MSDFNLITNDDQDDFDLAASDDANMDSLLSDEVVMQWLMDLEAQNLSTEPEDGYAELIGEKMYG